MKIGIDVHAAEREGTGNCSYIRGLLHGLAKIDRENDYVLYATDLKHPFYENFKNNRNFHLKLIKPKNPIIRIPFSLSRKSINDKLDILHVQYIAPPIQRGKLVVTIHDLAFNHFPESFSWIEKTRLKILVPINAKRAHKIITDSQFSKSDIAKSYNISPKKIEITYYAAASYFNPALSLDKKKDIQKKYGVKNKFIFSLSRLNARKNLETLLQAFEHLRKNSHLHLNLVIGGKKDFSAEKIFKRIAGSEFRDDIILTGYIPENELTCFYRSAEVFIYPSVFEGFGLPVLEAMACGCPVITSNVSSLPEITGDAGILVNPFNAEEISRSIYDLISDEGLKQKIRTKGLERAKLFNWEETARKTLHIYEHIHEK